MDIFLLGSGLLFSGFYINQSSKNPRTSNVRQSVSENETPNGDTVYESREVEKQTKKIQDKLNNRYQDSLTNPDSTIVHPNWSKLNYTDQYKINESVPLEVQPLPEPLNTPQIINNSLTQNTPINNNTSLKYTSINQPLSSSHEDNVSDKVFSSPVLNNTEDSNAFFRSLLTGNFIESFAPIKKEEKISSLSGKTLESTHNNMLPYFRGQVKQPGPESLNKLENIFKPSKQEVENLFEMRPDDVYGKLGKTSQIENLKDRISNLSLSNTQNGINPFQEEREPPLFTNKVSHFGNTDYDIRITPKTIDELRIKERPVLKSRPNAGSLPVSIMRPINYLKNKADQFFTKPDLGVSTGGVSTKPSLQGQETKTEKRDTYVDRFNPGGFINKPVLYNTENNSYRKPITKMYEHSYYRNAQIPVQESENYNSESYTPGTTLKEQTVYNSKTGNIGNQKGTYINHQKEYETTNKETTLYPSRTNLSSRTQAPLTYKYENYAQRTTLKEQNIDNNYIRVPTAPVSAPSDRKVYENNNRVDLKSGTLHKYTPSGLVSSVPPKPSSIGKVKTKNDNNRNIVPLGSLNLNLDNRNITYNSRKIIKKDNRLDQAAQDIPSQLMANEYSVFTVK